MKLGILTRISLIIGFAFALPLCAGNVHGQFRQPADTLTSKAVITNLPPLTIALREEPIMTSDTSKVIIPPHKQGFFCRFEDKMQMKWKLPLNLELK